MESVTVSIVKVYFAGELIAKPRCIEGLKNILGRRPPRMVDQRREQ